MGKAGRAFLNTVLTVRAHQANSHRGIGWEQFYRCGHPDPGPGGSPDRVFFSGGGLLR